MNSRRTLLKASVVTLLGVVGCGPSAPKAVEKPFSPMPLPAVSVAPLGGGDARALADVTKGRVAVIDLFATWCTACKEVTKNVELLAVAKKDTQLLVLGLDIGEDRDTVARFLEGQKPPYDIFLDPQLTLVDALGQKELPAVVVVDKTGTVRLIHNKLDAGVLKLVDELLAAP